MLSSITIYVIRLYSIFGYSPQSISSHSNIHQNRYITIRLFRRIDSTLLNNFAVVLFDFQCRQVNGQRTDAQPFQKYLNRRHQFIRMNEWDGPTATAATNQTMNELDEM